MKKLSELLNGVDVLDQKGSGVEDISTICFDSRLAIKDSLFVAVRGTQTDGHEYISKAESLGARVIICESLPDVLSENVLYIQCAESAKALGIIASNFYNNPSDKLKLVGITGTNGKTTVATLLYKLFEDLGYKTGLISTVENHIHTSVVASTHTTPDPIALNKLLDDMVAVGCDYCFMEVSSHAVAQYRIAGLNFAGGVFTNLSHDHLDFHKTFDSYLKAKKAFFDGLSKSAFSLSNGDDKNGRVMLQNTKASKKFYSLKSLADFKAKIIENQFGGLLLNIDGQEVWFKLVGQFNAYNLLAVYGTAVLLEQDSTKVLTLLSRLSGAEGRFDYVSSANGIIGIVDYAHTPDAVQNVLNTIHDIRKGREKVITILGCGGDRDKAKRPVMAQVASEWSDKVILTSDNPRSEDPEQIVKEMEAGLLLKNRKKTLVILDRKEAIRTACHLANPGDIILLAGKGHEKYQEIKGTKYPFDDKQILTSSLEEAGK
ncbi:UDP-N-acetylmuramoyl-L-alanyl-D-glutamate--2,6-diaminopimelate ligase [Desertivirga xinjiangensis]|uniref:UDP-N-acetylmuramoyl-L-alanyl-D-glutamate--2, 6-diaminopimelate ligase n=1 Tax=Desertivirga xinjiangensis TaxID=539206 RepID=UPI00210C306F|nr:UDP-N-acetylmuramoyl-L-alanyl-D-glutamate--2,6-diaminopimelate ligase [Pedobacter xinjiangensis]